MSALYRAIGLSGYVQQSVRDENGEFKLRARLMKNDLRCPSCGSRNVNCRGSVIRKVYAPPIGMRKTVLFIQTPRLGCRDCQCVKTLDKSSCTASHRGIGSSVSHNLKLTPSRYPIGRDGPKDSILFFEVGQLTDQFLSCDRVQQGQ
ncbi:transposase family protein [Thalassoglobus neptunius]|uniref:transposase family protein n=1 Tax=Thalassoglobus neptunius TaxID=1938619 RepID=UPI0011B826BF|nr:transposase family protein [Thalassoglobus neptunius]